MDIRRATLADHDAIWALLEPVIRAGDTYALDRDMDRTAALAYWTGTDREVFVAEDASGLVGTYYLRPNQAGGGRHVANCGYVTAAAATGRGVGTAMAAHSLEAARQRGYRAMQFNFVVSSNRRAVALWQRLGFEIIGTLPKAFSHPTAGAVDAYVMFRAL
ncbi:GNAT family N-acetyltransferase [Devosia sp.]|uniref:GNAT family N-acetyltransferase n=1 Tax=Devosia sp. TaxID=1871048 RepID=UPI003A9111AC